MREVNWDVRLLTAAKDGDADGVAAALREGANPLVRNSKGMTALMAAAECGDMDCVGVLLGVSDTKGKDNDGMTALMYAARKGAWDCVGVLLPLSDAKEGNGDGWTALMLAASHGHLECMEALLPGSDVFAVTVHGITARGLARVNGQVSCESLLEGFEGVVRDEVELERSAPRVRGGRKSGCGGSL